MYPRQHLSFLILNTLFMLCASVCRYDEDLILWNNTNYPNASGFYLRDYSQGVRGYQDVARGYFVTCSNTEDTDYNGTYIYYLPNSDPTLYLFQFHDTTLHSSLIISTGICADSNAKYKTDPTPILNGTNCDWTQIDSYGNPAVTWYTGTNEVLTGNTQLCDRNTGCLSTNPTTSPTKSPIPTTAIPSNSPTTGTPTVTPTASTVAPTKHPTPAPTVKPTKLPTFASPHFMEPPCVAMTVTNLHSVFPEQAEYHEKFNELKNYTYNNRRVWSNGKLEIFYTKRYEPGRWIVSNGTYHLINDATQLVHGGVNESFPGDDSGHGLYDHFPNDNPIHPSDVKYTLKFDCQNSSQYGTRWPSKSPSNAPSSSPTLAPTLSPSTAPTLSPIGACNTLLIDIPDFSDTNSSECGDPPLIAGPAGWSFAKMDGELNDHASWISLDGLINPLYYNVLLEAWIVVFKHTDADGQHDPDLWLVNPQAAGLETPPLNDIWYFVENPDVLSPTCDWFIHIECLSLISPTAVWQVNTPNPSPAPSVAPSNPPSQSPSGSPSQPPSSAPSQPPTVAPTSAPTLLCGGLTLSIDSTIADSNYDYFRGNYRREDSDDIADHFWWQSIEVAGSKIFYSDIIFHNSWVIQSAEAGEAYWILPEYHNVLHFLQPPLTAQWEYYTGASVFARDVAQLSFNCTMSLLPTTDPTLAPSLAPTQPPSDAPSLSPSLTPSTAPTIAPSLTPTNHPTTPAPTNAPSIAPTLAPTMAPTREACDFMQVYADDVRLIEFNGLYDIIVNGSNGFPAWSMNNEYGVYVIEKKADGNYWVINKINENNALTLDDLVSMQNNYNWRPPVYGDWQFWQTRPNPSRAPTASPTFAPSGVTVQPSVNPSRFPTLEPTMDPTTEPTLPTRRPSYDPTVEPTVLPTMGPSNEPTLEPVGRRRNLLQDPPQGTQVYGAAYKILMDCVNTDSPTVSPTTAEPSRAPTSKCEALSITGTASVDIFPYYGEYIRSKYSMNDFPWFLSTDLLSSLEYIDGHWTIMRRDIDDGNDEDAILIHRNKTSPNALTWLLGSPAREPWYLVYDKYDIFISIDCAGSTPPTPAPSLSPSSAPSAEMPPVWESCKQDWFTFVTMDEYNEVRNATYGVYWDVPSAVGEDNGRVVVEVIMALTSRKVKRSGVVMDQGDIVDLGIYTVYYRARNIYNPDRNASTALYNDCEVKLYVIGDTAFGTNDYCYDGKFSVDIMFNETYYEMKDSEDAVEYDADLILSMKGYATSDELRTLDENCYIYATQFLNVTEIKPQENDSKMFLGIEANTIVWDVLIFFLFLCLLCLCCYRMNIYYKKYKANKQANESQQALLANESEKVNSLEDDDDLAIGDIKPVTKIGRQPGASTMDVISQSVDEEDEEDEAEEADQVIRSGTLNQKFGEQETKGNDKVIDALIGDAFDNESSSGGFVTRGGGGDVEMGGDLPAEQLQVQQGPGLPPLPPSLPPLPPPPQPPQPPSQAFQQFDDGDTDSDFDDDSEFEFRV